METDITNVMTTIVDAFLPRGTEDKALFISIDARVSSYKDEDFEDEIREATFYDFIFYRPMNYTLVLYRSRPFIQPMHIQDGLWEQTSYHDSCWRTDGFSDMKKHHQSILNSVDKEKLDTMKTSEYITISNFDKPIDFYFIFSEKGYDKKYKINKVIKENRESMYIGEANE